MKNVRAGATVESKSTSESVECEETAGVKVELYSNTSEQLLSEL